MAKPVTQITIGVDVAKHQLLVHHWQDQHTVTVDNRPATIAAYLEQLVGPVRLALEPTSHYHLPLIEIALQLGHQVYLINPRQLAHYRHAVNLRHKTDPQDAWLLARYLEHEAAQLKPFQPSSRKAQRLWALITRRATVVRSRQQLQMSFRHLSISIQGLLTQYRDLLRRLDRHIQRLIRELGWWSHYQQCLSIPGIGPATAAALVASYHRGAFSSSDAFVAYLGLDVRLRESGTYRGKRTLTKQGEPELRRLLYCASHPARHHPRFADYDQRLRDRGMSKIAARVALARKLARIAFTLMTKEVYFSYQAEAA